MMAEATVARIEAMMMTLVEKPEMKQVMQEPTREQKAKSPTTSSNPVSIRAMM